jgi:hypothetical protein
MRTRPNGTSVEAPTKATGKQPKGSKLDARTRAEYQSEMTRVEDWDTSAWPTWTVTGRVLPERCDVNVPNRAAYGISAVGRIQLRKFQVIRSHIVAVCALEKHNPNVHEIADIVRSVIWFPIDYIAFQNRGAYEIVLDLCLNNQTGDVLAIPITEPTFEAEDAGLCFDAQADKSKIPIPWEAAAVPEFPTALHDLTAAARYPRRTFEYCRMAVGAVRRYFDPPTIKGHAERQREGEVSMCDAFRVTRKSLQALDAIAARSRHGELVIMINWEMRKRALEFSWELVARFRDDLQGISHDHWKLLDVRFED